MMEHLLSCAPRPADPSQFLDPPLVTFRFWLGTEGAENLLLYGRGQKNFPPSVYHYDAHTFVENSNMHEKYENIFDPLTPPQPTVPTDCPVDCLIGVLFSLKKSSVLQCCGLRTVVCWMELVRVSNAHLQPPWGLCLFQQPNALPGGWEGAASLRPAFQSCLLRG